MLCSAPKREHSCKKTVLFKLKSYIPYLCGVLADFNKIDETMDRFKALNGNDSESPIIVVTSEKIIEVIDFLPWVLMPFQ